MLFYLTKICTILNIVMIISMCREFKIVNNSLFNLILLINGTIIFIYLNVGLIFPLSVFDYMICFIFSIISVLSVGISVSYWLDY